MVYMTELDEWSVMAMAKVVVSQFISLDGVVEDPGGSEDFEHGGWAFRYERGAEGDRFKLDEVMSADALLLGRTTYEGFAEAWPSREGEFADKFNGMAKYVVSDTLSDPEWNNSHVISGADLTAEVEKLRAASGGDILVNGSVQLVQALVEKDLVDELRLMVYPVLLGSGKRLFGDTGEPKSLRLTSSQPAGETTILIYERASS
jgi:dihydrofolate reductase